MRLSRVTAAMVMASLSMPLIAASEQVGTLTSASQGTFVAREGKMVPAQAGQTLYAGDRVFTRTNAKAKVAMSGCSYTLASTSVLALGNGNCSISPRSMAVQDDEENTAEGSAATGTTAATVVVAIAAAAAIAAGIYVAVDENDSEPASP